VGNDGFCFSGSLPFPRQAGNPGFNASNEQIGRHDPNTHCRGLVDWLRRPLVDRTLFRRHADFVDQRPFGT
jgi:hypothetical protein